MSIKVVLHCQASNGPDDPMYGINGYIHRTLEESSGCQIEFVTFFGYLDLKAHERWRSDSGADVARMQAFISACSDADIVLVDAWTHPENPDYWGSVKESQAEMAKIMAIVKSHNPQALRFALLMEGEDKVAVHREGGCYAIPIKHYVEMKIALAINYLGAKKDWQATLADEDDKVKENISPIHLG